MPIDITGFDAETQGYITSRGLDKKEPNEALQLTIQAHRNAEAKLGAPADSMVRWPGQNDVEGWKAIHQKMGVPADATGYDFAGVKDSTGKAPDDAFTTAMRQTALAANLTPKAAQDVAQGFVQFEEARRAKDEGEAKLKAAMAANALNMSWGANAPTNKFIAERAASLLGLDAETLNALANSGNDAYPKVMEGLRQMGVKMGEAQLLGNSDVKPSNGPMTREEALSRKEDLINDTAFVKRWKSGDTKAVRELQDLDRVALGMKPLGGY